MEKITKIDNLNDLILFDKFSNEYNIKKDKIIKNYKDLGTNSLNDQLHKLYLNSNLSLFDLELNNDLDNDLIYLIKCLCFNSKKIAYYKDLDDFLYTYSLEKLNYYFPKTYLNINYENNIIYHFQNEYITNLTDNNIIYFLIELLIENNLYLSINDLNKLIENENDFINEFIKINNLN